MQRGSLQARLSEGDPRLYNCNRDVAHNFRPIMEILAARIEDGVWDELKTVMEFLGLSHDELGEAVVALIQFVRSSTENPREDMRDCLERSGFLRMRAEAQVAVAAQLGQILLGVHFAGVREATLGGVGPGMDLQQLAETAQRLSQYLSWSPWRRRLWRVRRRLARLFPLLGG